jgi:hypothetical protein
MKNVLLAVICYCALFFSQAFAAEGSGGTALSGQPVLGKSFYIYLYFEGLSAQQLKDGFSSLEYTETFVRAERESGELTSRISEKNLAMARSPYQVNSERIDAGTERAQKKIVFLEGAIGIKCTYKTTSAKDYRFTVSIGGKKYQRAINGVQAR